MIEAMSVRDRRRAFVDNLYALDRGTRSKNHKRAEECRKALARMRHVFSSPRQQADALEYIFPYDPPVTEQGIWLLEVGLFALNPRQPRGRKGRWSFGASMGEVKAKTGSNADRRFTQLLCRDREALIYYLRQTMRLLVLHDIPVDHHQLLDDLVVLLGSDYRGDAAYQIRLTWAREFNSHFRSAHSGDVAVGKGGKVASGDKF